jgi:glutamyl-Q tRNA(Asp) synthetase
MKVIGRFAPSPTGPLHLGSLVAAVGSYCQVKKQNGQWLLRMEDLDPPREKPGAADNIMFMLEAHGLHWDGDVVYQSHRHEYYQVVINQLLTNDQAYACTCTRKHLLATTAQGPYGMIYPGICRGQKISGKKRHAIRVRTHNEPIGFNDLRTGPHEQRLESELGDFIIKRSDGHYAYQLAVVVDDFLQGITEVVRGADLLDNTPRQIHLQQLLHYPTPQYLHLPLVTNRQGQKLSKQTHARALDPHKATKNLIKALQWLEMDPDKHLHQAAKEDILQWAVDHWKPP